MMKPDDWEPGAELCCRRCPMLRRPQYAMDLRNASAQPDPICCATFCEVEGEVVRGLDAAIGTAGQSISDTAHILPLPIDARLMLQDRLIAAWGQALADIYDDASVYPDVITERLRITVYTCDRRRAA